MSLTYVIKLMCDIYKIPLKFKFYKIKINFDGGIFYLDISNFKNIKLEDSYI